MAASVDAAYRYGYAFDDIGNRGTARERGTNTAYTANALNQYTAVDAFLPQYDADGNETLVKTATGVWSVTYNGENRPVRWENGDSVITMSYDRMGRRVIKNDQRFVYDGYLQIADNTGNAYVWDPTEPVATRPLAWQRGTSLAYYVHDGNKNVSEVVAPNNDVAAHYEYSPFGAETAERGAFAAANPFRFSSEYDDDETATVYYNYRHYEPVTGRWMSRDPVEDDGLALVLFSRNDPISNTDYIGLAAYRWGSLSDYNSESCGCCTSGETCRWSGYISGSFISGPFVGIYASMDFMAEGKSLNPSCNATWHVSGGGSNGLFPGGVFGVGWIKGSARFDDVILPCEWPLDEVTTGAMTFMGVSGAAGVKVTFSVVHVTVGNFLAWDLFGAGGLHIFMAGGGMVVPDMKVSRSKSCNQ